MPDQRRMSASVNCSGVQKHYYYYYYYYYTKLRPFNGHFFPDDLGKPAPER